MKVAPLLGAAVVIYLVIPGSNQEKGKPKFCEGADGNRYKKGESYEDKENCIRYTCSKIQNKLKMEKENIIPCTGDISTIVEISQKTKRTITDTNLNTVINFNVHNAMGSDCYSKYSKIYPYPAAKGKSLSECQTICTNNPECGAILMLKASIESGGSTSCYMVKPNNLFNEGTCTWGSGTYNAYEKKFTVFIYKVYKAMESSCYSKYTKISPYPAASSKSLSECQTICSDEPECGAIVMLKSSVESGGTTSCYMIKPNNLFNQGTCTWGNGNYNAYEKKVTGCVKDDNIDYHGNDIPDKNEIVNGLEGCIKWCGDTTACKYWTFAKSNQRCWLKTSDSGKRENSDTISGTKNCETVCTADAFTEAACFCKSAAGGAGEACTSGQKCNGDGTCQDESEPDLAANVTAIEASMQFLNDSMESIERKFEALQNSMQFLNDSMESIERKFEALQNSMESILEVIKATQSTSNNLESCLADISSSECPSPASGKTSVAREISDNTAALDDKCDATTCSFIKETVQELQQKFTLGSYETKMLIQLDTSTAFETAKLSSLEKENCTEEMKVTMKKYKETEDIIKKLRFKKPFIRSTELTDRLGSDSRLFTALKQTITRVSRDWTSIEAAERLIQFMSENFQKWAKKGGGLSILETRPGSEVSGDGHLVCSNFLQYRRIDGKCNNLNITDQGSAGIAMRRFMPNKYEDGVSTPRGGLTNSSLPSARVVSRKIHHASYPNPLTSKGYTLMAMQFGQFLDHDVTLTADMEMDCCDPEILSNDSSVCFNIDITGDDFYSGKTTCHSFTRSVEIVSDTDVREQINGITAYIDASNVYGSDDDLAKNLRTLVNGKLKTHADGPMLPTRRQVNLESKGPAHLDEDLVAGDMRAIEQPTLASIHSLFLNEHNRIADELRSRLSNFLSNKNQKEQDEIIYQESRKLVGAEMQNIVYNEFLPIVLGQEELTKHNLQLSAVTTYDDQIDPSIRNEFATVAFRFGHSLIAGMFNGNGGHRLKLTYFDESPEFVSGRSPNNNGRAWYSELTETSKQTSPADDVFCTEDVTNFLFSNTRGGATNFGDDLPARNIQRGRDHGLPPYNEFRTFCGLSPLEDFHNKPDEITAENWAKLKNTYNKVNDIDAWTGGLAETAPSDGLVGPTFACIIGKQFNVLKFGDRFFFNNDNGNGLKIKSRETIAKRNLGDIICDNTDTTILQRYVMIEEDASSNPQQKCSSRNPLDFDAIAMDITDGEPNLAANMTALETKFQVIQDSVQSMQGMMATIQSTSNQLGSIEQLVAKTTQLEDALANTQGTVAEMESCLADSSSADCPPPASGKTSMAGRISANAAALADKCDASTCSNIQEEIAKFHPKRLNLVLIGGWDELAGKSSEVISPTGVCKSTIPPLPFSAYDMEAVYFDNQIMLCGGFSRSTSTVRKSCSFLRNSASQWEEGPEMNVERQYFQLVKAKDAVFAIGGQLSNNNGAIERTIEKYYRGKWTLLNQMPTARFESCAIYWEAIDSLVVIGGFGTDKVEAFNIQLEQWSDLPSLPYELRLHNCALLNEIIYVIGGIYHSGEHGARTVLKYTMGAKAWEKSKPVNSHREYHSANVLDGKLLIAGSHDMKKQIERMKDDETWEYMPWILSSERDRHADAEVPEQSFRCL